MRNNKNKFFTFCVSLVPGAGEMYLGLYRQGISLMAAFFGLLFLGGWLGLELLIAFTPVIWFYSFFRTHNLRGMSEEEFLLQEDRYLLCNEVDFEQLDQVLKAHKKLIGAVLIFLGICMMGQIAMNVFSPFMDNVFGEIFWIISRNATRFMFGVVVIATGVYLFKNGRKKETEEILAQE